MKEVRNNKVGNVQNKTDTQTEREDETEINDRMYWWLSSLVYGKPVQAYNRIRRPEVDYLIGVL